MANRVIVATLYQGTINRNSVYLLNVSPRVLEVSPSNTGDNVYLIVQLGNFDAVNGQTAAATFEFPSADPFVTAPPSALPCPIGSIVLVGTINSVKAKIVDTYTLTVTYNGQTYIEDPKIQVDPKP